MLTNRSAGAAELSSASSPAPPSWAGYRVAGTPPSRLLAVTGAVLLAVVAGVLWWGAPEAPDTVPAPPAVADLAVPATLSPAGSGTITVHVSGAVDAPGLVELPAGSRVADAIAAAGGTSRTADLAVVNLAAPVGDGEQVQVPDVTGGGRAGGLSPGSETAGDGRVRVNSADVAELEQLPGVGPVLAQRIVAHRDQMGPFETVEDLLDVSGIGEGRLAALRDFVAIP